MRVHESVLSKLNDGKVLWFSCKVLLLHLVLV